MTGLLSYCFLLVSPSIIAITNHEVKVMPQLIFIQFFEENETNEAIVEYGEELIVLKIGDEIREMEVNVTYHCFCFIFKIIREA